MPLAGRLTRAARGALRRRIAADPYATWLGARLSGFRPGYARPEMRLGPHHLNFHGGAHGGAIFSLADAAFAAASNSHGVAAVAVSMSIHYTGRVRAGDRLVAEATEERCGSRIGFYRIVVRTAAGVPIAACQGAVLRDTGKGRTHHRAHREHRD